ncbi:hypothetical protein TNCV_2402901 [Trichonephila clavipes]|nr:hypothetical protein TNCV_2402901 [Trichonephila clavipes]
MVYCLWQTGLRGETVTSLRKVWYSQSYVSYQGLEDLHVTVPHFGSMHRNLLKFKKLLHFEKLFLRVAFLVSYDSVSQTVERAPLGWAR